MTGERTRANRVTASGMTDLNKEIGELKQFIIDLKADRSSTKEKEKRESWTRFVSLTLVVIAVIATVAQQASSGFGGTAQKSQALASSQWAYYQAKSIKQHTDEVARTQLVILGNAAAPGHAKAVGELESSLARYESEKTAIRLDAERLERQRDEAKRRGGKMATAVSLFTVAIAIASICLVTKKKPLWFVSMLLAALAITQMILAWTS